MARPRSSFAYDQELPQAVPSAGVRRPGLFDTPVLNFGGKPSPAKDAIANPQNDNRDTITVVSKDPGKKPVRLKVDAKHRNLPPEEREFATVQAALKDKRLVADYHPVVHTGNTRGKPKDYSGMHVVGPVANVARANGAVIDAGVVNASRANIESSTLVRNDAKVNARDANISGMGTPQPARVEAQDAVVSLGIRTATLEGLAGAKTPDRHNVTQLKLDNDQPTPHTASIRARKLEEQFPVPRFG